MVSLGRYKMYAGNDLYTVPICQQTGTGEAVRDQTIEIPYRLYEVTQPVSLGEIHQKGWIVHVIGSTLFTGNRIYRTGIVYVPSGPLPDEKYVQAFRDLNEIFWNISQKSTDLTKLYQAFNLHKPDKLDNSLREIAWDPKGYKYGGVLLVGGKRIPVCDVYVKTVQTPPNQEIIFVSLLRKAQQGKQNLENIPWDVQFKYTGATGVALRTFFSNLKGAGLQNQSVNHITIKVVHLQSKKGPDDQRPVFVSALVVV